MKTQHNIFIAFVLNLFFSIFEVFGGILTGSIAIISDAIHDFGDALSIGISFILEKKSHKKPNNKYTYGYQRYSILGALITTLILCVGECFVIYNSIDRIFHPVEIEYDKMIILAIVGVIINLIATKLTKHGDTLNERSVNLHMLEDVLGWIIVLIGSILMKFTNINLIDSIMSIGVALFILYHTINNFKVILDLFLIKTPDNINISKLKEHLLEIEEIEDIHHIHIWSINGEDALSTMHVITKTKKQLELKQKIREELKEHGISHVTIELETPEEHCLDQECTPTHTHHSHGHNHNH